MPDDTDQRFRANKAHRPYDRYLSTKALEKARQLRVNPTGDVHKLKHDRSGRTTYPWKKMELGDMFFAPVAGRSLLGMRTAFNQAAARHDLEIVILRINDPYDRSDCLRVSVSAIGIRRAKWLAYSDGKLPHPPSTGTYKERRAKEARDRRAVVGSVARPPKIKPGDKKTDPFWSDSRRGQTDAPSPHAGPKPLDYEHGGFDSSGMTKEQIRAKALALALGKKA